MKKVLIIAGEPSGDLHGSALIDELLLIDKNIKFYGIGGDKMSNSGLTLLHHINEMAFLGFVEVIKHIPFIKKVKKDLINFVEKENINNIILIDYPGFNLSLAKTLKKSGRKNIYYISPQIWAWGKGRIKKIKYLISKMIVFFPFEDKLYKRNNVNSDFIGHPLVYKLNNYNFLSREKIYTKHDLANDKDIILLLPGSRKQELDKILPELLPASQMLIKKMNMQVVIACADNIDDKYFDKYSEKYSYKVVKGDTYSLLKNAKFSIVKSGTSTLEAGIIGNPFLVVYKTNYLTYLIGKLLIKIDNIALANIVAEKTVVKELIQNEVNPKTIFNECSEILLNESKYNSIKNELSIIKNKLDTQGNPSKKAASIIYSELDEN